MGLAKFMGARNESISPLDRLFRAVDRVLERAQVLVGLTDGVVKLIAVVHERVLQEESSRWLYMAWSLT
jgi:hypothetical protein